MQLLGFICAFLTVSSASCDSGDTVQHFSIKDDMLKKDRFQIFLTTDLNHAVCKADFLSVTIDSSEIRHHWKGFDFR